MLYVEASLIVGEDNSLRGTDGSQLQAPYVSISFSRIFWVAKLAG